MRAGLVLFLWLCGGLAGGASRPGGMAEREVVLAPLVGRPSADRVVISMLPSTNGDVVVEYGVNASGAMKRTPAVKVERGVPREIEIGGLAADTVYSYRARITGEAENDAASGTFRTARGPGSKFTFTVQGDSHPERLGRMFDPDLYRRALGNVAADKPDFHFLMGDDFSIERLIERENKSQDAVNAVYVNQRSFLSVVGRTTPLMLVNGNHEQAAKYLLDGTATNFAVFAGRARTAYFPLPAPDDFYTGNPTPVEHVGLLRDYYAWQWGDALFVVIDPYWHSDVPVDNEAGVRAPRRPEGGRDDDGKQMRRGKGERDLWQITLGDEQYRWLTATLTQSTAPFKFVFSHHVSGTGRGGIEVAPYYEWGGQDRRGGGRAGRGADGEDGRARFTPRGMDRFFRARPTWEKPIHDLMRDAGVTIFFQGHDHLYARQELDGVIYQSCPNPADPTFTAFNREAYRSGDIFPNSGHLRISVNGASSCTVEYVRAARPGDEAQHGKNGSVVHEYTVRPRAMKPPARTGRREDER